MITNAELPLNSLPSGTPFVFNRLSIGSTKKIYIYIECYYKPVFLLSLRDWCGGFFGEVCSQRALVEGSAPSVGETVQNLSKAD